MRIDSIRLLEETRVKWFIVGLLMLIPGLLLFLSLGIHLTIPKNFGLFISLYLTYGVLIVFGISLLFNTSMKLIIAHLFMGISLIVLSLTLYSVFSYRVSTGNESNIITLFGVYVLTTVLMEFILIKKRLFNFEQLGKMSDSFWMYILGLAIGKGGYEYLKHVYGNDSSSFMSIASVLVVSVIVGFYGILYINKYYLVRYCNYQSYIS